MARNEEENSAVSLFSFQDIITSITGIMFLVVLMLIIMLVNSSLPDDASEYDSEIKSNRKYLQDLQKELAQLQLNNAYLDEKLAALNLLSPEEYDARKQQLQQQIAISRQQLSLMEQRSHEQNQLIITLQTQLDQTHRSHQQIHHELAELNKDIELKENEKSQLQRQNKIREQLLKYTVQRHSGKSPLLLEVKNHSLKVLQLDRQQTVDLSSSSGMDETLQNLERFLLDKDPELYYFSAVFAPGAFQYAQTILSLLKKHQFERGIEILPNDRVSLWEEPEQ